MDTFKKTLTAIGQFVVIIALITSLSNCKKREATEPTNPKQECANPPSNMTAWYKLNEQNGATTISDIAGSVMDNGIPMPNPVGSGGPMTVAGKVGSALYFYGPYVEVAHSNDLAFSGDSSNFSIDAWVRVVECGYGGGGVLAPIVDKYDSANKIGFSLFIDQPQPSTGYLKLQINNSLFTSTGSLQTGANPPQNTGPWVHVAVSVDRKNGIGTFYINGSSSGTFTPPIGSITNTFRMFIGEIRISGGRCEIAIDELELFNKALTQQEVKSIFLADTLGKCR